MSLTPINTNPVISFLDRVFKANNAIPGNNQYHLKITGEKCILSSQITPLAWKQIFVNTYQNSNSQVQLELLEACRKIHDIIPKEWVLYRYDTPLACLLDNVRFLNTNMYTIRNFLWVERTVKVLEVLPSGPLKWFFGLPVLPGCVMFVVALLRGAAVFFLVVCAHAILKVILNTTVLPGLLNNSIVGPALFAVMSVACRILGRPPPSTMIESTLIDCTTRASIFLCICVKIIELANAVPLYDNDREGNIRPDTQLNRIISIATWTLRCACLFVDSTAFFMTAFICGAAEPLRWLFVHDTCIKTIQAGSQQERTRLFNEVQTNTTKCWENLTDLVLEKGIPLKGSSQRNMLSKIGFA